MEKSLSPAPLGGYFIGVFMVGPSLNQRGASPPKAGGPWRTGLTHGVQLQVGSSGDLDPE